jgi:sterol 3beta-glucosyltransferase
MKALLICVGSRGDTEPFCALADRLLSGGHQVEFFIQPEYQSLAPAGANIHTLPFTHQDFYRFVGNPTHGADHENPRVKFVGVVTDIIAALVLPCWKDVLQMAETCNLIVTSALARSLSFAISQKLEIPVCLVHLQPLIPTEAFPHYSQTDDFMAALTQDGTTPDQLKYNKETYVELERYQHEFLEERLDAMYSELELEPNLTFEESQSLLSGNRDNTWIANSFYSPELIPAVTDVGPNVHHVGPLADAYIPKDFTPEQELSGFLIAERPICVGYGSMPYNQVEMLLEVLEEINCKAVLVGKALEIPAARKDWATNHVRQVASAPYAWLLPNCEMMLCHGGAGVVHTTLRAGIPLVISPLMGDQFAFARLIQAKRLGARAGASLPTVTKEELIKAIQNAKACIPAAKAFGERVRSSSDNLLGVERMVQLLEKIQR